MRLVRVMPRVVPTNREVLRCIVHVGQNGIAGESGHYLIMAALEFTGRAVQYLNRATYQRLLETCSNVL